MLPKSRFFASPGNSTDSRERKTTKNQPFLSILPNFQTIRVQTYITRSPLHSTSHFHPKLPRTDPGFTNKHLIKSHNCTFPPTFDLTFFIVHFRLPGGRRIIQFIPIPNRFGTKNQSQLPFLPSRLPPTSDCYAFSASPSFATDQFYSTFLATRWTSTISTISPRTTRFDPHTIPSTILAFSRFPLFTLPVLSSFPIPSLWLQPHILRRKATIRSLCARAHTNFLPRQK